ncbi:MAG TPA: NADH-quinone oxidoreductase subunit NuoE [Alphaproteobacteria bacterium]|nr:NADH-quinone oxidoreductase subunit NuoE [Alphaproteobacteria bacterium]
MSAAHASEPASFAFTPENRAKADAAIAKYPKGRQASAVLALFDLAQRQSGGWLPRVAIEYVAGLLGMPYIRAYEVATFYSMLNLKPVGQHLVQLCRTTPCWLRGSDGVRDACKRKLGIGIGETTADGKFTLVEVECLGACVNAPVVQIDDEFYEDLDPEKMEEILARLARGEKVPYGAQIKRQFSAPVGGLTTLKEAGGAEKA